MDSLVNGDKAFSIRGMDADRYGKSGSVSILRDVLHAQESQYAEKNDDIASDRTRAREISLRAIKITISFVPRREIL